MSITDFLNARIAEDEQTAKDLLRELERTMEKGGLKGAVDERGPFTPDRQLSATMWAFFAGQTPDRNFKTGQDIARLASPKKVLAECAAKRAIVAEYATVQANPWDYADAIYTAEASVYALAAVYADHPEYQDEWRVGA